jgi:hypothetical protein
MDGPFTLDGEIYQASREGGRFGCRPVAGRPFSRSRARDPVPGPELLDLIERRAGGFAAGPELATLTRELQGRYAGALAAVLFYGSCLRSGDVLDGVVDAYVVVDSYRAAYRNPLVAATNWVLPPNVLYLELPLAQARLRCKYAVLSMAQLLRATSAHWFHSYFWGRLTQPTVILYARGEAERARVLLALAQATLTFVSRTLPLMPERFITRELWEQGLAHSYAAELRAEGAQRGAELFATYAEHYDGLTRAALALLPYDVSPAPPDPTAVHLARPSAWQRHRCRLGWAMRRLQGKALSVLRLVKGLFTFHGGVDYVLWKLERHTGTHIEVPDKVRRHPLIYGWGLMWRLYRQGLFR